MSLEAHGLEETISSKGTPILSPSRRVPGERLAGF
jgi:hypothetical protein